MVGREESPRLCAAITCFAEPYRTEALLQTIVEQGGCQPFQLHVFEDPSTAVAHSNYLDLCKNYGVPLSIRSEWGCMQGVADFALAESDCDWFLYVPDDVLPTPGYFEWVARWINTLPDCVGALQTPYWNYCDLFPQQDTRSMYRPDHSWLRDVPWNPHWYGPCLYLNVNGAGFAIRKDVYNRVGPLDLRTWCLDEWLSWKLWTETHYVIVSVPGPPTVHMGGATTAAQHSLGHAHLRHATNEGWVDAVGKSKQECADILRATMRERGEKLRLHPR